MTFSIPTWVAVVVIALLVLGAVGDVTAIGLPREPVTKGHAVLSAITSMLFIVWIIAGRSW